MGIFVKAAATAFTVACVPGEVAGNLAARVYGSTEEWNRFKTIRRKQVQRARSSGCWPTEAEADLLLKAATEVYEANVRGLGRRCGKLAGWATQMQKEFEGAADELRAVLEK